MVTVPKSPIVRTQGQTLPSAYESGAGSGDIRAFGGGDGLGKLSAGLENVGNVLGQIHNEIQAKQDVIDTANATSAVDSAAAAKLRDLSTEADLSDPKVGKQYTQFLDDTITKTLSGYEGSGSSRAALAAKLTAMRGGYVDQMSGIAAKTQSDKLQNMLGERVNSAAALVRNDPGQLVTALDKADQDIHDFSPALTPEQEMSHRKAAQGAIVSAAFEGLLDRGAINQAEHVLLDTPGVDKMFTPSQRKALYDRIRTARAQLLAEGKQHNQSVKGIPRDIFDRLPKPAQDHIMGIDEGGAVKTADERIRQSFATDTHSFANGTMTDVQQRRFIADVNAYIQPRWVQNPNTGQFEEQSNKLPSFVVDALSTRGIKVPESAIGGISSPTNPGALAMPHVSPPPAPTAAGAETPPATAPAAGAEPKTPQQALAAAPTADQAAAPKVPDELKNDPHVQAVASNPIFQGVDPGLFAGGKTIGEMGDIFTGPISALKNAVGHIPILGWGGGDSTSARQTVPLVFRRLVAALQTNPRYSEGERASLAKELSVEPKVFDNSAAFLDRMVGIDRALEYFEKNAQDALKSKDISLDQRKHDQDTLQMIESFRRVLLPPRIETPKQEDAFARANPPGTKVLVKRNGYWVIGRVK